MFARWLARSAWVWAILAALILPGVALATAAPPLSELRPGTGSPPQPTDAMMRVGRALMGMRGNSLSDSGAAALDSALVLYPNDVNARFLRASLTFCGMRRGDLASASADIDSALAHFGPTVAPLGTTLQNALGLKAQIELALGNDGEALGLIEKAIRLSPDDAENLFNPGTTDPDSTTLACNWRKATLSGLVGRHPSDYRAYLARGIYYGVFRSFNTTSHSKALQDLLTARKLAPSSALCRYFLACEYLSDGKTTMGRLFTGTSVTAQQNALREFTAAISLDPRFSPAYVQRADLRMTQKQYSLAIKDYDAIITLEPNNASALNDRGLAKKALGNCWGAVNDFTESSRIKVTDPTKAAEDATLYATYESRAACHAALGQFSQAADDMTEALRALLTSLAAPMSLSRLRDLFPECSDLDDDTFLHTIHDAFCSTMPYSTFESLKRDSLMNQLDSSVVPADYVQRGDYLLRAGDLRKALADYSRARRAFPNYADVIERWHLATENDNQAFYIDSQADLSSEGARQQTIWVKAQDKKKGSGGWNIHRIVFDCRASTMQVESSTTYGADGTVIASDEVAALPSAVAPESIGEWFAKALCK